MYKFITLPSIDVMHIRMIDRPCLSTTITQTHTHTLWVAEERISFARYRYRISLSESTLTIIGVSRRLQMAIPFYLLNLPQAIMINVNIYHMAKSIIPNMMQLILLKSITHVCFFFHENIHFILSWPNMV